MLLFHEDSVWDMDLDFLAEVLEVVDSRLSELESECERCGDPDQFGTFDRTEHTVGLGFVAAQTYLAAICGDFEVPSWQAFSYGPVHESGEPVARLVNHAANYWKHQIRWLPGHLDERQQRTLDGLAAMDIPGDYPLSTAMAMLTGTHFPRSGPLVPLLTEWRDALIKLARSEGSGVRCRVRGAQQAHRADAVS